MSFLVRYKLLLAGLVVGALAGYAYYYFIGCASGSCAITSRPFNSSAYGAVMGALLFTAFKKKQNEKP
jgi:hypothetical protein